VSDHVSYMVTDNVARITFTRADKLNALTPAMFAELGQFVERAATDASVRAIVLAGEGRAFAAGADVEMYVDLPAADFRAFIDANRAVVDRFAACPKPIIAVVQGYALGGGFELVLASDLVIAAGNARLGLPEANLGLLPGGGGTQRLPKLVGRLRANELIMTGRILTAAEALAWGLVNVVCARDELDAAVAKMLDGILAAAPTSIAVAKRLVAAADATPLEEGLIVEAELTAALIETQNGREGIAAFVEKRPPSFGNE
jgi:enoyl-CoA hydratase/carnithine racemase